MVCFSFASAQLLVFFVGRRNRFEFEKFMQRWGIFMKYLIKNHGMSRIAYACMQYAGCLPFQLKKPALETVTPTCMHVAGVCAE